MKFNKMHCFKYKDNYNLYNRIKKINKNHELYFDSFNKEFLIVNSANNYEICLNFSNFNQNIEEKLKFSQVSNITNYLNFLEEHNHNLEIKSKNIVTEKTITACIECLNLTKKSTNISYNDINKIIGEIND